MKEPSQEDWEAVSRVCEYYQARIKGTGITVPVALPMLSSDPAQPIVTILIHRAMCLVNKGTIFKPDMQLVYSPRHLVKGENENNS